RAAVDTARPAAVRMVPRVAAGRAAARTRAASPAADTAAAPAHTDSVPARTSQAAGAHRTAARARRQAAAEFHRADHRHPATAGSSSFSPCLLRPQSTAAGTVWALSGYAARRKTAYPTARRITGRIYSAVPVLDLHRKYQDESDISRSQRILSTRTAAGNTRALRQDGLLHLAAGHLGRKRIDRPGR